MERLIVLGTGAGITVNCYSTCFLLQKDERCLLVDTGSGNQILNNIKKLGVSLNQIHDLFISHKHIDHLLGIIPFIRKMLQDMKKNEYVGNLNIYCDKEIKRIVDTFIDSTFHEAHIEAYKKYVKYTFLENTQILKIIDYDVEVLDLYSKECIQYGFKTRLDNGKTIAFLGDVPLSEKNYEKIKNVNIALHECFCLETEKEEFKPYEKNHSTVKDVAEIMKELNVEEIVLWHTIDNNISKRKELYTNEATKYFNGKVFVPEDLEIIDL